MKSNKSSKKGRILVVEDSSPIRAILFEVLISQGYEVDLAENGLDAMSLLSGAAYDLVVLDIVLPKVSGEKVIRFLSDRQIPAQVIAISASKDLDELRGHVFGGLQKPFPMDELVAMIERALETKRSPGSPRTADSVG